MRFTCAAGSLSSAVSVAATNTPSHPQMPVFAAVQLDASCVPLQVRGADGMTATAAPVSEADVAAPGQALVPPGPLGRLLGLLPADEPVDVDDDGARLTVTRADHAPYRFHLLDGEMPQPPAADRSAEPVAWSSVAGALRAVSAPTGRDHPGVRVGCADGTLTLDTTDHYRACRAVVPDAGFGGFVGVLPAADLQRAASYRIRRATEAGGGRTVTLEGEVATVNLRLLASPFPPVEQVIDGHGAGRFKVDVDAVAVALNRLAAVAGDSPVRLHTEHRRLTLSASSADVGEGVEHVALTAPPSDPTFSVAVNRRFLADAVEAHRRLHIDEATVRHGTGTEALHLTGTTADGVALTHVVMPIRM